MSRSVLAAVRRTTTVAVGSIALAGLAAPLALAGTGAATTRVNIRSGPSTATAIVGELPEGVRITTVAKASRGWVPVRFDGGTAYIASRYLDTKGELPAGPTTITAAGMKITTEALNVRSGPGTGYRVVTRLAEGADLTVTGKVSNGFAQTRVGNKLRWVSLQYLANARGTTSAAQGEQALAYARRQLGKPYRFGAEGPDRFDCSGLTMMAWRSAGISIPRVSRQQWRGAGQRIAKEDLRPGDLVFFYNAPSHVALYAGEGRILHAARPGTVIRYAKLGSMPYKGAVRPE